MNKKRESEKPQKTNTKTSEHAGRYLVIGTGLALFNYSFYTFLANIIINNNDFLWLSTFISTAATTILAYFLHSKITWKERNTTKSTIYQFLIWNIILTIAINPLLTQLFSYVTPLYELAYNICQNLHILFTYEFIQSTGAFVLTAIITTILNFFFYDRFVFGKKKQKPDNNNPES